MTGLELRVALVLVPGLMCAFGRGLGGGGVFPGGPRIPGADA